MRFSLKFFALGDLQIGSPGFVGLQSSAAIQRVPGWWIGSRGRETVDRSDGFANQPDALPYEC